METIHLIISGKVQGVFFRESARKIAEKLEIKGWIKNVFDGNVEALVTGEEKGIKEFVSWCRQGPERAEVVEVKISKQQIINFEKFEVIRRK